MCYEIKNNISSILVLIVHFLMNQNKQQLNLNDLKKREEQFEQFE